MIGKSVRAGIKAMGLKLFPEGVPTDTVTVIHKPNNVDIGTIIRMMREKYHIIVSGAPPSPRLQGRIFRIGHMGLQATPNNVISTLSALEMTLRSSGFELELGAGVEAARRILEKAF